MPSRSAAPGRMLCCTTSAEASSRSTTSFAAADLRSMASDRLPRFAPSQGSGSGRMVSPTRDSTFTTSAPRSLSSRLPYGDANQIESSTMRTPSRGCTRGRGATVGSRPGERQPAERRRSPSWSGRGAGPTTSPGLFESLITGPTTSIGPSSGSSSRRMMPAWRIWSSSKTVPGGCTGRQATSCSQHRRSHSAAGLLANSGGSRSRRICRSSSVSCVEVSTAASTRLISSARPNSSMARPKAPAAPVWICTMRPSAQV